MKISSVCLKWKSRLLATKMQANLTRHLVVFSDYEAKPCFSIDSHVKIITKDRTFMHEKTPKYACIYAGKTVEICAKKSKTCIYLTHVIQACYKFFPSGRSLLNYITAVIARFNHVIIGCNAGRVPFSNFRM